MYQPVEVEMGDGEPITFFISEFTRQVYATGGWPTSPSFSHGDLESLRDGMTRVIRQQNWRPPSSAKRRIAMQAKSPPSAPGRRRVR